MFLDDVYGEQSILRDMVIPKRLVTSCEHFHREAAGIQPPNGVRIHVAGIDLIRDEEGQFRVLEDNLRSPSGVSYVMENRRTMARVFPDLFASNRVRAVGDYATHLLRALRAAAALNEADPTVVVLTPGVANSAYFEHSLLARLMGVELVEGRDLFCRDNVVYMRTSGVSATHGAHHEPHTLSTTTLPLACATDHGAPVRVVPLSVSAGPRWPGVSRSIDPSPER